LAGIAVKRIVDWRGYQDYEFQIDGNGRITHCRLARIAGWWELQERNTDSLESQDKELQSGGNRMLELQIGIVG
jgi:hypothetical protein